MRIPCIRCNTLIDKPNANNAKYIVNELDTRTHGPRKFSKFFVVKGNEKLKSYDKHDHAISDALTRRNAIKKEAEVIMNNINGFNEALSRIPQGKANENARNVKIAEIMTENNRFRVKQDEIYSVGVLEEEEIRIVAKTGIICRSPSCQDPADKIIWG